MKHVLIKAFDLPSAWYRAVNLVYREGDTFRVERGSEISLTKKLSVTLEIAHPEHRPLIDEKAPCDIKYVEQVYLSYLFLPEKSPEESYTYGERLRKPVDQIEEVIKKYKEFKSDRQNTMVLRLPQDLNLEAPPCLTIIDTEVSDDQLHFFPYFRSWDCYAGLPANLAGIQILKEHMAKEIGVKTGKTVTYSKNLHLYERQLKFAEELLIRKIESKKWWEEIQAKPSTR
ncbi:thymidylate synthase [Candidatus Bathyarchaeota archaeon]|nr:thymidylate synthase [Candidatus Bathyarchaeota archaeon]